MAKKTTNLNIQETGPVGLQGIRNSDLYLNPQGNALSESIRINKRSRSTNVDPSALSDVGVIARSAETEQGKSMFDDPIMINPTPESIQDTRASNQPWYAQLAAGVGKGAVLAGTTFVNGTLGLVAGIGQIIGNAGKNETTPMTTGEIWSGFYDNPITRAMDAVNKWSEEVMPNYYSTESEGKAFDFGSMNFWADKVIKNLGFTVGAAWSGAAWSRPLSLLGKALGESTKFKRALDITKEALDSATRQGKITSQLVSSSVQNGVGALTSALGEGSMEALNTKNDMINSKIPELKAQRDQRVQAIIQKYGNTAMAQQLIAKEDAAFKAASDKVKEDAAAAGNVDLVLNIPILTLSNLAQFTRLYSGGFKKSLESLNVKRLADGTYGKLSKGREMAKAFIKPILAEGNEEAMQQYASDLPKNYYNTDIDNFYKAKTNREDQQETLDWLKSMASQAAATFSNADTWEQFFIGGLTGALGAPNFLKTKANGKTGFGLGWNAESFAGMKEASERATRYNYLSDYMNDRIQNNAKFKNYYQGIVRHNAYAKAMDMALEKGDAKAFHDSDLAQLYSDFTMFDSAGRLDDLKEMALAAVPQSKEDVEQLIENTTTKNLNEEEQKKVDEQNNIQKEAQQKIDTINQQVQELLNGRDEQQISDEERTRLQEIRKPLVELNDQITSAQAAIKEVYDNSEAPWVGPYIDEQGNKKSVDDVTKELNENIDTFKKHLNNYQAIKEDLSSILRGKLTDPSREKDVLSELIFRVAQADNWKDRCDDIVSKFRDILPDTEANDSYLARLQQEGATIDDLQSKLDEQKNAEIEIARKAAEKNGTLDKFDPTQVKFSKQINDLQSEIDAKKDNNKALTDSQYAFRKYKASTNEEIFNLLLGDNDFRNGLYNYINNSGSIAQEKKADYTSRINDAIKMLIAKQNASLAIAKYLEDPNTLAEEQAKIDEDSKTEEEEANHKDVKDFINNSSVSEINEAKNQDPDYLHGAHEEWFTEEEKKKIKEANDVEAVKNLLLKRVEEARQKGIISDMLAGIMSRKINVAYSKSNSVEEITDPTAESFIPNEEDNLSQDDLEDMQQFLNDLMHITKEDIKGAEDISDFLKTHKPMEGLHDTFEAEFNPTNDSKAKDNNNNKDEEPKSPVSRDPVTQPKPLTKATWAWEDSVSGGIFITDQSVQSIAENPEFITLTEYDDKGNPIKSYGSNMFKFSNGYYMCVIPIGDLKVPMLGFPTTGGMEWRVAAEINYEHPEKSITVQGFSLTPEIVAITRALGKRWNRKTLESKGAPELNIADPTYTATLMSATHSDTGSKLAEIMNSRIAKEDKYTEKDVQEALNNFNKTITDTISTLFKEFKKSSNTSATSSKASATSKSKSSELSKPASKPAKPVSSSELENAVSQDSKKKGNLPKGTPTTENPVTASNIYNYWRDNTSEYQIYRERGDDRPYYEISGNPAHKIIYEYLKNKGTFTLRTPSESNEKLPEKLHFAFDPKLNEQLGFPVLLMVDENGNVWSDLPNPKDANFGNYKGLKEFYEAAEKELGESNGAVDANGFYVLKDKTTSVSHVLIGTPHYTKSSDRHTLNEIASTLSSMGTWVTDSKGPKIGIMINDDQQSGWNMRISGDETRDTAKSMHEKKILPPLTYKNGQPFLLIRTSDPNRRWYPVPFTMRPFSTTDNSKLSKIVSTLFDSQHLPKNQSEANSWAATLKHVLALEEVNTFFKDGKLLSIRIKPFGAEHFTNIKTAKDLEGITYNIDSSLIGLEIGTAEDEIFTGLVDRMPYNSLIGEVAETNLPQGGNHTINDSFIYNPIIDNKEQKEAPSFSSEQKSHQKDSTPSTESDPKVEAFKKAMHEQKSAIIRILHEAMPSLRLQLEATQKQQVALRHGIVADAMNMPYLEYRKLVDDVISGKYKSSRSGKPTAADYILLVYESAKKLVRKGQEGDFKKLFAALRIQGVTDDVASIKDLKYAFSDLGKETADQINAVVKAEMDKGVKDDKQKAKPYSDPQTSDPKWYTSERISGWKINPADNSILQVSTGKVYALEDTMSLFMPLKVQLAKLYAEANGIDISKTAAETPWGWVTENSGFFVEAPKQEIQPTPPPAPSQPTPSSSESKSPVQEGKQEASNDGATDFNAEEAKTTLKKLLTDPVIRTKVIEKLNNNSLKILADMPAIKAKGILMGLKVLWRSKTPEQLEEYINTAKAKMKLVANTEYQEADLEKEVRTLTRMLPQLDREGAVRLVDGLIKTVDGDAYGKFYNGIITLSKRATQGTTYHEGFHYVVNTLFSTQEKEALFKHAEQLYGTKERNALEEAMADDFSKYVQDRENGVPETEKNPITRFFKKLWNMVSSIFSHKAYVDSVYRNIYNGRYANRSVVRDMIEEKQKGLRERGMQLLQQSKEVLDRTKNMSKEDLKNTFSLQAYYSNKYKYENLSIEQQKYLQERGIKLEDYNNMSNEEKQVLFKCMS